MKKLWSVTVKTWGMNASRTYWFDTRESAEDFARDNGFECCDGVVYAGRFTDANAERLMGRTAESMKSEYDILGY